MEAVIHSHTHSQAGVDKLDYVADEPTGSGYQHHNGTGQQHSGIFDIYSAA